MNEMMTVLYNRDGIKITQSTTPDEHDVEVGENYCYLSRGMLREFAESDEQGLRMKLGTANRDFLEQLYRQDVSVQRIGWAFSQARIRELDQEFSTYRSMRSK